MLQSTMIFGLPGAGKSALARSLIHEPHCPPSAWFADDDRTLSFDATCIDTQRSAWAAERVLWFRSGSCFVMNLDLTPERLKTLEKSGITQVFVVCTGEPSVLLERLQQTNGLSIVRRILVVDAAYHSRVGVEGSQFLDEELSRLVPLADTIVLNKRDLTARDDLLRLRAELGFLKPGVELFESRFGRVVQGVLAQGAGELGNRVLWGPKGALRTGALALGSGPSELVLQP
jgi:G3E family GTPase